MTNSGFSGTNTEIDYLALLREVLGQWYARPRDGWHVSDVLMCPRQKVFRTILPSPLTDREINMFSSGKSIHEAIQRMFLSNRGRFETEKYVEYLDIQGSIDIYDKKANRPIEFKTSRTASINEPKSFHVEQLKYYMAMLDVPVGHIIYQCLLNYGNDPFRIFKVTMSEKQRMEQLAKLTGEMRTLQAAISSNDPSVARGVYSDPELNWLCRECPYAEDCERMVQAAAAA